MRAARYDGQHVLLDEGHPEPEPGPGDAVVRPVVAAVAPSDLAVVRGSVPFRGVIGHQCVGMVESVAGDPHHRLIGTLAVPAVNVPNPESELARRGLAAHDPDRRMLGLRDLDGCFAERFVVPASVLTRVPEQLDPDRAVFYSPVAEAVHASQLVRLEGKQYVTVLGDSVSAILCAQLMSKLNASVRLLGRDADRLALCERWGIKHRHADDVGLRQDQDVVVDCTGQAESVAMAMRMVRPRGKMVVKTQPMPVPGAASAGPLAVELAPVVMGELQVIGAGGGSPADGLGALATSDVDVATLISARFPLADAIGAIRAAADRRHIRVLVDF